MGDFNIAQFLGGIVEGMGKGLTSDKGGSDAFAQMEVIPKKKNAPPVIEMTPSQTAATDIVKGAGEAVAMGQPMLRPSAPVASDMSQTFADPNKPRRGPRTWAPEDVTRNPNWTDQEDYRGLTTNGSAPELWKERSGHQLSPLRQMRSGGITEPGEEVIVHENEKVQGLPNGQVIVTPEEEVAVDRGMPQPNTPVVRQPDRTPERPPNMAIPETVEEGENDVGYLERKLLKDMEVKPSPWKDLGAALIQAGNNHFNNKNEPIRTWGEIQRDKRVAPTAGKLALVRDAKDRRTAAEAKAAQLAILQGKPEQAKAEIDRKNRLADVSEMRALNDGEYKRNLISLGREKAEEIRTNNEKMFELRQRGVDQNDERMQILRERNAVLARQGDERIRQGDERIEGARLSREDLNKYRGASLQLRQAGSAAGLTPKQVQDIADRKTKLKAALTEKVRAGKMTQADMNEILSEKVDAGFGAASGEVDK